MDLPKIVAVTPIDKQVKVLVIRDGKQKELHLTVATAPTGDKAQDQKPGEHASIGISVQEITPELAQRLRLSDVAGVVITEVKPGSPAEEAGISRGELVLELNGQRVDSIKQFSDLVASVKKGDMVRLLLRRPDGSFGYVAMKAE